MPFVLFFSRRFKRKAKKPARKLAAEKVAFARTLAKTVKKTGLPPEQVVEQAKVRPGEPVYQAVAEHMAKITAHKVALRKAAIEASAEAAVPTVVEESIHAYSERTGVPFEPELAAEVAEEVAAMPEETVTIEPAPPARPVRMGKVEYAQWLYTRQLAKRRGPGAVMAVVAADARPVIAAALEPAVKKVVDSLDMLEELYAEVKSHYPMPELLEGV